jgi:hypothetical protein
MLKIKQMTRLELAPLMLFVSIFSVAASAAMAQSVQSTKKLPDKQPARAQSNMCPPTQVFTYGTAAQKFNFCISDHGNIQKLESPGPYLEINTGEGYVVCSQSGVSGFDAGFAEDGWGAATVSQPGGANTLPLTITRQSTDGKFELKQTFDWNGLEKEVSIAMELKNLTAASITNIQVTRYFDGDLGGNGSDDTYTSIKDSVFGLDFTPNAYKSQGIMLTALSLNVPHSFQIESFGHWNPIGNLEQTARQCLSSTPLASPASSNDLLGRLIYNLGTLGAGGAKKVLMVYRRI